MLDNKNRIALPAPVGRFLDRLVQALQLEVLPISPAIAVRAQASIFEHKDPADRLIAATAMVLNATLITQDRKLAMIPELRVLW